MVLDALGVNRGDLGVDTDRQQESVDDLMALSGRDREAAPLGRKFDGLVGLGRHEPLAFEAFYGLNHRDMGDAEAFGEVPYSASSRSIDAISDGFDIVLGQLGGVVLACSLMRSGFGGL